MVLKSCSHDISFLFPVKLLLRLHATRQVNLLLIIICHSKADTPRPRRRLCLQALTRTQLRDSPSSQVSGLYLRVLCEIMSFSLSCFCLKKAANKTRCKGYTILASETSFTVNEVEALFDLFKKLSSAIIDDGLIHKEEFQFALLENTNNQSLFFDRLFDMFDIKHNGVIDFEEFVRTLSIFHPNASEQDKVAFAFRLFDLGQTGYIERDELKEMVLAILTESDLRVSDDVVESIVDKTMVEADFKGDGKIDEEEWKEFVAKNPSLLKIMTLPCLKEITLAFPSFVLHTRGRLNELAIALELKIMNKMIVCTRRI